MLVLFNPSHNLKLFNYLENTEMSCIYRTCKKVHNSEALSNGKLKYFDKVVT